MPPDRGRWTPSAADHGDATQALTPALVSALDEWEVSLPPQTVVLTVEVMRALATIDRIAKLDGAGLLSALDAAEEAYAPAVQARLAIQRLQDAAAAEVAARMDEAAALAAVADVRVLALVRGDR